MNTVREIAYRIDPALWMQEVLGITPPRWQKTFLRAPRAHPFCSDGASGWQNHRRRCGNGAFCIVHARVSLCDCLSRATPKCRSPAASARDCAQGRRRAHERQCFQARTRQRITRPGAAGHSGFNPGSDRRWLDRCRRSGSTGPNIYRCIASDAGPCAHRPVLRCCRRHGAAPIHSGRFGQGRQSVLDTYSATVDVEPTLSPRSSWTRARRALGEDGFKREYLGIPGDT